MTGALTNLANDNLKGAYGNAYVSEHGDVTLAVEQLAFEYSIPYLNDNQTLHQAALDLPTQVRISSNHTWSLNIDSRGWVPAKDLDVGWARGISPPNASLSFRLRGAFAQPGARNCKILLSLHLIVIVIISNGAKVAVFIYMLLDETPEPPLVTIGDAISSFLTESDQSTASHCTFSREEYVRKFQERTGRTRLDITGSAAALNRRPEGVWQPRTRRYGSALNRHKSLFATYMSVHAPSKQSLSRIANRQQIL